MKVLNICLSVNIDSTINSSSSDIERIYQNVFKKLISFLYEKPYSKMTFSFTGPQLIWLEKNHPEFLQLTHELIHRKQVELIGGGYYSPVFPLLFPVDRSGQIELLTSEIRRLTGKRPRGMNITSSVWDNSLVPCIKNCGMEYIFLDNSILPPESNFYLPLILNEQGKTVKVIPVLRNLAPSEEKDVSPESYINSLIKQVEKATKNDIYSKKTEERNVFIHLSNSNLKKLLDTNWLDEFFEEAHSNNSINLSLPYEYIHREKNFVSTYISPGLRDDIARWSLIPYTPTEIKNRRQITVYNFMQTYHRFRALYNRMLYVSLLINQCHGDKARKNAARGALWKAQSGDAFICSPDGIFANNAIRQSAYRSLTEAEKYVRSADKFRESVTSFDYNSDGHDDYICSMDKYTACITPVAGCINELDVMHNTGNYTDNMMRIEKFDKVSDNYERGLFIDHLFSREEYNDYKKGLPTGSGIFSQVMFDQAEFSGTKKEIKLKANALFSNMNLPVSLRKNYIANSNGFTIQYILKNEGPIALKGVLVVESNFAQTDFTSADTNSYKVDVVSAGDSAELGSKTKPVSSKNVSFMQITDTSNDISFVLVPNEECSVTCMPLYFRRPTANSSAPQVIGTTFVSSLVWDVDLAAGMEMEKTINFSIITPKKHSVKSKTNK